MRLQDEPQAVRICWRMIVACSRWRDCRGDGNMTPEEQLIRRYFQTFNRHNIEGVMDCFHEDPVLVGADGKRIEGRAEVRRCYEESFASFPDGRCQLRLCTGNDGHAVAESRFLGTRQRDGH